MAETEIKAPTAFRHRIQGTGAAIRKLKPTRVWLHYVARRGPLLAAGLSYQAIFSVFAAVWAGFSVTGLLLGRSPELRDGLLDRISGSIPGLFNRGTGGAINPDDLFSSSVVGWVGVLALIAALLTAIGWLASARDAVRDIAELAAPPTNFLLLRLRDLGLAIAFGVALILSAALTIGSTTALAWVLDGLGVDEYSMTATVAARVLGLALTFVFDVTVLAALYRVLAGVPIPPRPLWKGALLGGFALGVLKVLAGGLLTLTSTNPLLASFAVIVGLLIWFNLVCHVILIGAAWVVVSATDAGAPLDPVGDRRRREAEARLRLEIEEELRAEIEGSLPRAVRWLARRRRRT
ncbi:MAG TPA: YihY/virulence factor BrkB family protein [Pseudolysinimonas sp.]